MDAEGTSTIPGLIIAVIAFVFYLQHLMSRQDADGTRDEGSRPESDEARGTQGPGRE